MFNSIPFGGGISLALAPVDLATNPVTKWAKVRDVNEFLVASLLCGVGAVGANPIVTLQQGKGAFGPGEVISLGIEGLFVKQGAPLLDGSTDIFTQDTDYKRVQDPVQPTYDFAGRLDMDISENVMSIMVRPIDLMEDFTHVRLSISCPGAKMGCAIYSVVDKAYSGRAIADCLA
jgi:hypothetical protein